MNWIMIVGLVIVLIVIVIIAIPTVTFLDVMSYTATGGETLSPAGAALGRAMVVYDPGVSGSAKNTAVKIAGELQSKGYTVNLAGVRSATSKNVSGYDVIVVGGPAYGDKMGSSAQSYLQDLSVSQNTKVGVFATGIIGPKSNDSAYMANFVSNLPDGSPVKVKSAMKRVTDFMGKDVNKTGGDVDKQCNEFVTELLQ